MSGNKCLMSEVCWCQTSDVICLITDVWCETSYGRGMMSDVSFQISDDRCLMSDDRCLMSNIWCQTSDDRCLITDVWCQMSDERGMMSDVWCQLTHHCEVRFLVWSSCIPACLVSERKAFVLPCAIVWLCIVVEVAKLEALPMTCNFCSILSFQIWQVKAPKLLLGCKPQEAILCRI